MDSFFYYVTFLYDVLLEQQLLLQQATFAVHLFVQSYAVVDEQIGRHFELI